MTKYCVLKDGTVYNFKTKKKLKPQAHGTGYACVNLNRRNHLVHRLVAKGYVVNLNNKSEVNHIDGNKQNNHASNLEWSTRQENVSHACKTGLYTSQGNIYSTKQHGWMAAISFQNKRYQKCSRHNRQVVEDWLQQKRKELYPCENQN